MKIILNSVTRDCREYVVLQFPVVTFKKFVFKSKIFPKKYFSTKKPPNALKTRLTMGGNFSKFCQAYFAAYIMTPRDILMASKEPLRARKTSKIRPKIWQQNLDSPHFGQ